MKLSKLALMVSILPVLAFGRSPILPDSRAEVASTLHTLEISNVGTEGEVLKQNFFHPTTTFLIGIPAQVNTGSACVDFVGQETQVQRLKSIRAVGATNPMQDACIAVMPMPVHTKLTLQMKVLTGGFVPAGRFQQERIHIEGAGNFVVTLDMDTERVTVRRTR